MGLEAAKGRARELADELRRHERLYYIEDAPEISDQAYDELFQELKGLEESFPELRTADSPTQRVGGAVLDSFPSVSHEAPMLSLDSDVSPEALERFDERIRKSVETPVRYVLEPKLDGASVELVYEAGVLTRASTRGDGQRGEGITENVRTISSVPLRLDDEEIPVPDLVAVRGEVILHIEDFERYNEDLMAQGKEPYANPRNSAAGALRQLDPSRTARRPLDIFVYDILAASAMTAATQWEVHEALRAWGLKVNDRARRVASTEEILDFHRELETSRDDIGYEMDGLVVKLDDLAAREVLGSTSHHPRWAFALKFEPRKEVTRLLKIVASVGRTGKVTPVAMMRPVEIGGVTVSRATLHNREEVARKDVREGDRIRVQRAGDVIPQVVGRIEEPGRERAEPWTMPRVCPSCGTPLIERGPFSVCPNGFECPAQLTARITHFGSRHALDVEGLGEETARLMVDEGMVRQLPDLLRVKAEDLVPLEGFAEKSAQALEDGIRRASTVDLDRFLYALGIPEVGRTVARALAGHFGSLPAVRQAAEEELQAIDGIGPRMAAEIHGFFTDQVSSGVVDTLLARGIRIVEPEVVSGAAPLEGKRFVFTGGLEAIGREEAKARVEALGGKVTSSVSGKTDFVVVGADPGSKAQKARDLGVEVLDEAAFLGLLR